MAMYVAIDLAEHIDGEYGGLHSLLFRRFAGRQVIDSPWHPVAVSKLPAGEGDRPLLEIVFELANVGGHHPALPDFENNYRLGILVDGADPWTIRSLSVGDRVTVCTETHAADGIVIREFRRYRCDPIGWTLVGQGEPLPLAPQR